MGKKKDVIPYTQGTLYLRTLLVECEQKGWKYVGGTMDEKDRQRKWNNPKNKSYGGKKIQDAREKYGVSSTAWGYQILEQFTLEPIPGETDEERKMRLQKIIDEKETAYIEKYDSVEHGFNTSCGGTGTKGVKLTPEQRKQCGDNRRGKPLSKEAKEKISKAIKGRKVSEETRAKISKGNKGRKRTPEQRKAESDRMKGKTPWAATAGAKEWVIKNGGGYYKNHPIPESAKANMKAAQQSRVDSVKAIYPDGREEIYPSMNAAADALGMGVGSIHHYLNAGAGRDCIKGCRFERIKK